MNKEFDFDPDLDFEEIDSDLESFALGDDEDDDLAEFDALIAEDDEDDEPAWMRTAVLQKNHMVALLCIKSATRGAAICRVDPREDRPAVQLYADPEKAFEWFRRSLRTSKENGWSVVYDGLPLRG
jgi:hypothetical protein